MQQKKVVAIFYGGKSVEHDVSVLSALQAFNALDQNEYDSFLVYVDLNGKWWIGDALSDRRNYHFSEDDKKRLLHQVEFCIGTGSKGVLRTVGSFMHKSREIYFDVAFMAFHGTSGEDGKFQGLMESAGYAYTGTRVMASSVCMNKALAKSILRTAGVKVLPEIIVKCPKKENDFLNIDAVTESLDVKYPAFVKPCNLGSSVGIAKAVNDKELKAALLNVFRMDDTAIIEPYIEKLEEYNISVTKAFGDLKVSAIERPIKKGEFLEFKDKYLAGGNMAAKLANPSGEGMADLSRVINPPELTEAQRNQIIDDAKKAFTAINCSGAPRIDFLMNKETGDIYLCELNTIPGSFAFYLWEQEKISFTKLLSALVEEALFLKAAEPACHFDMNATIFKHK